MTPSMLFSAVIGICFGGLAGALLTNFLTYYRARPQSVGYRVEVVTLAPQLEKWQFHARINIQNREGTLVGVDRLDLVRIEVTNQGNRDMPGFGFGVTLPPRIVILDTKLISPDRHHSIEQEKHRALPNDGVPDTKVVLGSLGNIASSEPVTSDFKVHPFNRKETYTVQLVTTPNRAIPGMVPYEIPDTNVTVGNVSLSTAEVSVVFREMPRDTTAEIESIILPILQRTSALVVVASVAIAVITNLFNGTSYLIPVSILLVLVVLIACLLVVAIPINRRIAAIKSGK